MLAGMGGPSMFENLMPNLEPTAKDMEDQAKEIQYQRTIKLTGAYVKTYDTGTADEAKKYAKLLEEIFHGIQARTHVIIHNDRQFVSTDGNPRWIAHIEWLEFELKVKPNPAGGKAKENSDV